MEDFIEKIEHLLPKLPPKDETKCKCWKTEKSNFICCYCSERNEWSVNEGLRTKKETVEPPGKDNMAFGPEALAKVRKFNTGATRDSEEGKLDYEGFLSPLALERYAKYMHSHRKQSDGQMRASDNWQKGIPLDAYMKSLWRHLVEVWTLHRKPTFDLDEEAQEEALCAVIFNAFGYLHEVKKAQGERNEDQ